EVLVDFWSNHFNIDAKKGTDVVLVIQDQKEVIRPNVLGKFRDLLEASAKSSAMLEYLDNASSMRNPDQPSMTSGAKINRQQQAKEAQRKRGLNENYGRELLELHTLGVDGGYTQDDVIDV